MNLFEFTTKSAYIDSLTLIKDLEEELRKLAKPIEVSSYYISSVLTKANNDYQVLLRPFILFTKCFKKFEDKSSRKLPDFLYDKRKNGATAILETLISKQIKITYDEYIATFNYLSIDLVLPMNYSNLPMDQLTYMVELIEDKPNPYTINYTNLRADSVYSSIVGHNLKELVQTLELRQLVYTDKQYTILEDFIDREYAKLSYNNDLKLKAENLIVNSTNVLNAIKEFSTTVNKKVINNA